MTGERGTPEGGGTPWLQWRRPPGVASAAHGSFVDALRTLQDAAVCADPPGDVVAAAAVEISRIAGTVMGYAAPEGVAIAGRASNRADRGSLLLPDWEVQECTPDVVVLRGGFRRFHLGLNGAVHGGAIPLVFDHLIALVAEAYGRPVSRTVRLGVDYRALTPIDQVLTARGRVMHVDGRKTYLTAEIVDAEGRSLCACDALMVALGDGQI